MDLNTNSQVRAFNKKRIINAIYKDGPLTKQQIANILNISLPTVNTIVKELKEKGVVTNGNVLNSTGGRKATSIMAASDFGVAIGVEVASTSIRIALVDMTPTVVVSETHDCNMDSTREFWTYVNEIVMVFIRKHVGKEEKLLGVSVALPLPVMDGHVVQMKSFSERSRIDTDMIRSCFEIPVQIINSSKVAAFAQIWVLNRRENFQYLNVGSYIAGAVVYQGDVVEFDNRHAEYGNILVKHNNKVLRVDEICTSKGIQQKTGYPVKVFFEKLEQGDEDCQKYWEIYLDTLSVLCYNIHCILNWDIAIGGSLSPYIKKYMNEICERLKIMSNFVNDEDADFVSISDLGEYSAATGAALSLQDEFLERI